MTSFKPHSTRDPARVAILGTYLPRRCGIATFSGDLLNALRERGPSTEWWSVAMNDTPEGYRYPGEVRFEIRQNVVSDYRQAVEFLNMNHVDAVCLQHEFGIFGGRAGSHVLHLLRALRMPIVTTLHTVPQEPDTSQREVLTAIGELSDRVVVMSEGARRTLRDVYAMPAERVAVIPHGVPDMPFLDTSYHKDQFGLVGKDVIFCFGLISRGKGFETVIDALPRIVAARPNAVFVIVGATHPGVQRHEGEAYRLSLQKRARDLGVDDHVVFHDRFIETPTLIEFLSTADVCVTPYLNAEQIVSGVLSYMLGAGKAIVSTPYRYAEELLADGRGKLVPFRDAEATADAVIELLSDDTERNALRKRAYLDGRKMLWSEVGKQYLRLLRDVRRNRVRRSPRFQAATLQARPFELPSPNFDHLRVLTDGTGILQHARYSLPDRSHGYCTDDNARALIVALMAQHFVNDASEFRRLANRYLSFLQHAFNESNGRFRNFMSYDRTWQEEAGSEDADGRALWALGQAVQEQPSNGIAEAAMPLFNRALDPALEFDAPRALAYSLLGIHAYLGRFGGASEARRAQALLADRLFRMFGPDLTSAWFWPEERVTYANGIIPQALICSGAQLGRPEMVEVGLRSLDWLLRQQIAGDGYFAPIGNQGWLTSSARARFDQQPIEVQHMLDACIDAYRASGEKRWLDEARRIFEWFLGRNDLKQPLYNPVTGGGFDGLSVDGVNQNQGAESTLAWLHALMRLHTLTASFVAAHAESAGVTAPPAKRKSVNSAPVDVAPLAVEAAE